MELFCRTDALCLCVDTKNDNENIFHRRVKSKILVMQAFAKKEVVNSSSLEILKTNTILTSSSELSLCSSRFPISSSSSTLREWRWLTPQYSQPVSASSRKSNTDWICCSALPSSSWRSPGKWFTPTNTLEFN